MQQLKSTTGVLLRKELRENLENKRILIMFIISMLICGVGLYNAFSMMDMTDMNASKNVYLDIFTKTNGSLPSFASLLSFLLPLVGLSLGFDSINAEKVRGTLSRLMAQPIFRDSVIIAKFLSGIAVLSFLILFMFGILTGSFIIVLGIPPTPEEALRIFLYVLVTIFYVSMWYALALALSIFFEQATVSALVGIGFWIFMTFFVNMFIQGIASLVYPAENTMDVTAIVNQQKLIIALLMFSPLSLYSNVIAAIMNPEVRSLGLVFYEQMEGAIKGQLPLSETFMVILPHLLFMIAFVFFIFLISYIGFIRKEIRST